MAASTMESSTNLTIKQQKAILHLIEVGMANCRTMIDNEHLSVLYQLRTQLEQKNLITIKFHMSDFKNNSKYGLIEYLTKLEKFGNCQITQRAQYFIEAIIEKSDYDFIMNHIATY